MATFRRATIAAALIVTPPTAVVWLYGWLLVVLLAVSVPISMWIADRLGATRAAVGSGTPASAPGLGQAVVIGLFMWVGYLLVLWALSLAPLSVVAPVRETAVVGVAIW